MSGACKESSAECHFAGRISGQGKRCVPLRWRRWNLLQKGGIDERNAQKSEMRVMWIMTAVIVLIILGLMGFNMLTHPDWMHGL